MRDCRELLNSLHIGEPGCHELLMVSSALVIEEADGVDESWPTTAALLILDADSVSQRAIRELALRFQYGAVSVLPLEQPGDAALVLAQSNSAVVDLVVLCRSGDLAALDRIGPHTPGMRLLVHDLPSAPPTSALCSEQDAMFDGFVNGLDDPLGSAVKAFQMLASLRAPGTLNCMDYEDFLSVFAAGRAVHVVTVDPPATHPVPAGWSDAHVLTNGTDAVIVFDSRTGRLSTIKEVLNTVRACPWFHEDEGPSFRYLGTKKYFRPMLTCFENLTQRRDASA
jgi:hypothetical protein